MLSSHVESHTHTYILYYLSPRGLHEGNINFLLDVRLVVSAVFPPAQRACNFDISADRNVWLRLTLRSFAMVCDYMEATLLLSTYDHMEPGSVGP